MLCALQATARGVPSLPTWMALDTDIPAINERLRVGTDPFTGDPVMNVRGLALDVALLHVPAVDTDGNVYVDGDLALDGALARAADRTIVCYEQVGRRRSRAGRRSHGCGSMLSCPPRRERGRPAAMRAMAPTSTRRSLGLRR